MSVTGNVDVAEEKGVASHGSIVQKSTSEVLKHAKKQNHESLVSKKEISTNKAKDKKPSAYGSSVNSAQNDEDGSFFMAGRLYAASLFCYMIDVSVSMMKQATANLKVEITSLTSQADVTSALTGGKSLDGKHDFEQGSIMDKAHSIYEDTMTGIYTGIALSAVSVMGSLHTMLRGNEGVQNQEALANKVNENMYSSPLEQDGLQGEVAVGDNCKNVTCLAHKEELAALAENRELDLTHMKSKIKEFTEQEGNRLSGDTSRGNRLTRSYKYVLNRNEFSEDESQAASKKFLQNETLDSLMGKEQVDTIIEKYQNMPEEQDKAMGEALRECRNEPIGNIGHAIGQTKNSRYFKEQVERRVDKIHDEVKEQMSKFHNSNQMRMTMCQMVGQFAQTAVQMGQAYAQIEQAYMEVYKQQGQAINGFNSSISQSVKEGNQAVNTAATSANETMKEVARSINQG